MGFTCLLGSKRREGNQVPLRGRDLTRGRSAKKIQGGEQNMGVVGYMGTG